MNSPANRRPVPADKAPTITALVVAEPNDARPLPESLFTKAGCAVVQMANPAILPALCARHRPQIAFLPLTIAGQPSLAVLRAAMAPQRLPVVVVVADNDQINAAAEAMRDGAFDCLFRPFSEARLAKTIDGALGQLHRTGTPAARMAPVPRTAPELPAAPVEARPVVAVAEGLVAAAPATRAVLTRIDAVARSAAPVLFTGEVGTGKTRLARLLHDRSDRASQPFVTIDCATLTTQGIASAAWSGDGALARAKGGTLFLDNLGAADPAIQPQMIGMIDRTTGPDAKADVRLLAALRQPEPVGRELRPELFYRLSVATIALPPLRQRLEDIAALAPDRLAEFAAREGRAPVSLGQDAMAVLVDHRWPGNLHELVNLLWRLALTHDGPLVTAADLTPALHERPSPDQPATPSADAPVGQTLAEIERAAIEAAIEAENGSIPRAARLLDVSPSTLYRKREGWRRD